MTITFESDNDVIFYALEKIISFCRDHQYLFSAQCVWWLAALMGLQQGLIVYVDNLNSRSETVNPEETTSTPGYIRDPLRRTRSGKNHPDSPPKPLTKGQRKKLNKLRVAEIRENMIVRDKARQEYFRDRI
jgi:hypothetical protein